MGLFKPAWLSYDKAKALKAVEKVSSQDKLYEIARRAPLPDVSAKAISKISEQSLLADIVRNSWNSDAKKIAAIKRITSQTLLKELVIELSEEYCRRYQHGLNQSIYHMLIDEAMSMINEQELLAEIARKTKTQASCIAVEKINDQYILERLAQSQFQDYKAKINAIQRVESQDVLESIALNCMDGGAKEAIRKIENQDTLKRIVLTTTRREVRKAAIESIEDKDFIEALKREKCHQWEVLEGCIKICAICGETKGEHRYKEVDSDYYSGRTYYKCTVCGHSHSEYTSMGHG